jgi:hypothetical protein
MLLPQTWLRAPATEEINGLGLFGGLFFAQRRVTSIPEIVLCFQPLTSIPPAVAMDCREFHGTQMAHEENGYLEKVPIMLTAPTITLPLQLP